MIWGLFVTYVLAAVCSGVYRAGRAAVKIGKAGFGRARQAASRARTMTGHGVACPLCGRTKPTVGVRDPNELIQEIMPGAAAAYDDRPITISFEEDDHPDLCAWCGHPGHRYGQPCAQSAAGRPGNLDGSPHMCGCVPWVGPEPSVVQSVIQESPERPSPGLVVCEACGHPHHTPGDGQCAFLAPSRLPSGQTELAVCGCTAGTDRLVVTGRGITDPLGECTIEPECPLCDADVCTEHDPAFNDLQTYLEGGTVESLEAAKRLDQRLDQRGVDAGQISPKAFWDTWGELPVPSHYAHRIWCAHWRQHSADQCPVWGAE